MLPSSRAKEVAVVLPSSKAKEVAAVLSRAILYLVSGSRFALRVDIKYPLLLSLPSLAFRIPPITFVLNFFL